jgi:long-subunit fatty acid transport protein
MKFLTALVTTLALAVTQPAYAQVYTQQEINYLQAMEKSELVYPDEIQSTLPYANAVCTAAYLGMTEEEIEVRTLQVLMVAVKEHQMTYKQGARLSFILGVSYYYAREVLCPESAQ